MTGYRILYHHRIRSDDGQAVHVRELIAALRELGHTVLECALVPKSGLQHVVVGQKVTRESRVGKFFKGLEVPRRAREAMEVLYSRQGAWMLKRAAKRFQPDFIYERHALHCRSGLIAARSLRVPLLLEVNSPMADEMAELGLLRFPRLARATERKLFRQADRVLPVTNVLRQRLLECGAVAERTVVIGNGSDPRRYDALDALTIAGVRDELGGPEGFVVGFVSYVRDWHRLDLMLEAMKYPDLAQVRLALVGEGPGLEKIYQRASELKVQDRVITLGNIDSMRLPAFVKAFDAALIPAINAYASPLKLFDSLAAGVPTLAPDQPNLRECIVDGRTGLLFQPGDAVSLTTRLLELVKDPRRAIAIGRSGRASLDHSGWTWLDNARRVISAFEECRR